MKISKFQVVNVSPNKMPEPKDMVEGIIFIDEPEGIAIHLCACGCKQQTVTPLSPMWKDPGWSYSWNGDLLTLNPSIGNFNFPCKSHYFIKDSEVVWC